MARPKKPLDEKLIQAKTTLSPAMFDRLDRLSRKREEPLSWVIRDLLYTTLRVPKTDK